MAGFHETEFFSLLLYVSENYAKSQFWLDIREFFRHTEHDGGDTNDYGYSNDAMIKEETVYTKDTTDKNKRRK